MKLTLAFLSSRFPTWPKKILFDSLNFGGWEGQSPRILIYLGFGVLWLFSGNLIVGKANKGNVFEPFSKKCTYTLFFQFKVETNDNTFIASNLKKIISQESTIWPYLWNRKFWIKMLGQYRLVENIYIYIYVCMYNKYK